jgi:hypothetical protein
MRKALRTLIWIGAYAVGGLPAPVTAEPTISKSQIRSDPPSVTHERLRDVVWSMFEREDFRRHETPTRPLDHLFLRTKFQATLVPGLCRYDSVLVEFERIDPNDKSADAQTRAVGLTSTSMFKFVVPPKGHFQDIATFFRESRTKGMFEPVGRYALLQCG